MASSWAESAVASTLASHRSVPVRVGTSKIWRESNFGQRNKLAGCGPECDTISEYLSQSRPRELAPTQVTDK